MTTTAFDDQFTPSTQTILRVNVIESQQQIHDLQTRLAAAIERAGAAEAELAKMRELPNVPIDAEAFEIHRMNRLIAADPKMNAPCSPTDEQIHAAYRNALGQAIRERDLPEIRKFARALLQSAEVQAVDKWQLTPATTHPVDRKAGEVRHD